jgi:predicted RNase H-like HicB family nuclease
MKVKKNYKAVFSLDTNGRWIGRVEVSKRSGANTHGRTIEQVRERMREALAAHLDCEPDDFELLEDVQLPAATRRRVVSAQLAAEEAKRAEEKARTVVRSAAQALVRSGLSLRDAGAVLGVSRQRVDQILRTS